MVAEFEVQYSFWEAHTAFDGHQINQSNREFQPC